MKFKNLPTSVQIVIGLVGLAALTGIGVFVYQKIKKLGENKDTKKEADTAKNTLQDLQKKGVNPTISAADAESACNLLQQSASGCDPTGTGATEIMRTIYSIKNAADWYLLVNTFGTRTWDDCGPMGDVTGSLTTLITDELDTTQITEARRHLSQFGITF